MLLMLMLLLEEHRPNQNDRYLGGADNDGPGGKKREQA